MTKLRRLFSSDGVQPQTSKNDRLDSQIIADVRRECQAALQRLEPLSAANLVLSGAIASLRVQSLDHVRHISDAGFRVSSQWGEDGILDWIIGRLHDPVPSFVEFGVEHYHEANTRFLLQHRNWRGLIADSSSDAIADIYRSNLTWRYDLTAVQRFIDAANINELFRENQFTGEIGLLSIDIDGQDYWVWEAITAVNPQIVVCEYNAILGDLHPILIPFDPSFARTKAHPSNLYWGASIVAIEQLARSRGYTLIGSNLEGCNAFFIRDDLMPQFEGRIADRAAKPSLFRESRNPDASLSYIRGEARAKVIQDMPIYDIRTGLTTPLSAFDQLYSASWRRAMGTGCV